MKKTTSCTLDTWLSIRYSAIWNKWQDLLKKDGIPTFPITFQESDHKCGSAAAHAKELSKKIGDINKPNRAEPGWYSSWPE